MGTVNYKKKTKKHLLSEVQNILNYCYTLFSTVLARNHAQKAFFVSIIQCILDNLAKDTASSCQKDYSCSSILQKAKVIHVFQFYKKPSLCNLELGNADRCILNRCHLKDGKESLSCEVNNPPRTQHLI